MERRRGSCCRAEPTQKEVPLVEESLLRFFPAPVARKSPAKVVSRSPARPGHVRLSANVISLELRNTVTTGQFNTARQGGGEARPP